jgi:hypothetical protein
MLSPVAVQNQNGRFSVMGIRKIINSLRSVGNCETFELKSGTNQKNFYKFENNSKKFEKNNETKLEHNFEQMIINYNNSPNATQHRAPRFHGKIHKKSSGNFKYRF